MTGVDGLYILTGKPGAGKTSWCLDLLAQAQARHIRCDGILSPAVFTEGVKTAIDILDPKSGERKQLAVVRTAALATGQQVHTERWLFVPGAFEWGNKLLMQSGRAAITFIDEIGPVEFGQGLGLDKALWLLDKGQYRRMFLTLRLPLVETAIARWPVTAVLDLAQNRYDVLDYLTACES